MELFDWFNRHPVIRYWPPVYACMAFILYFSLSTSPPSSIGGHKLNFNIMHLAAYFFLCFFMSAALAVSRLQIFKKNPYLLSIFLCFLFGGFTELMQSFVPGRSPSLADVIYNTSAIIFYPLAAFALKNIRTK